MAGRRISKATRIAQTAAMLDDRLASMTIRAIAAKHHVGAATVQRRIDEAMDAIVIPKADELRKLYNLRYERLLRNLAPAADLGDVPSVKASTMILDHLRRLAGTDPPSRSFHETLNHGDDTDSAIRDLVEQVNVKAAETTDA